MTRTQQDAAKEAVGREAAALVMPGMRLGLGTGSTASAALRAIGQRVREEGLDVVGVATSYASEHLARECGIPLVQVDEVERLDLAMDGADEVDPMLNLIKGRGAAHSREKVIAAMADKFVVLADPSKIVDRLGVKAPVPIEVMPMALAPVMRSLEQLGARAELRVGVKKDGPVVTDQGFWIVDAYFGPIADAEALNRTLKGLPGVLDHGLFLGMASLALVGAPDGSVRHLEPVGVLPPIG
ncbi:MAG TPA: ribose-5-phosphate isomerase RpiA [Rhodothermales bacterium]